MEYYNDLVEMVGNTPLLKLNHLEVPAGIEIYAKLEMYNPLGSVKDRVGVYMLKEKIQSGELPEGGTIIEGTAGNTGIGTALAALNRGFRVIFIVPDKFSGEKQTVMKALGAEVINIPRDQGMQGVIVKSEELHEKIPNSVVLNQFQSQWNPKAHFETTGPEIYQQMDGMIDYFVAGAGSGGTFSGTLRYLQSKGVPVKGVLADPVGSIIGGGEHGDYEIEGIGNDFVADTMDVSLIDQVIKVTDEEALSAVRLLAKKEGVLGGTSTGAALTASFKLAQQLKNENPDVDPERNIRIVTVFPDSGERYYSKGILDPE